MWLKIKVPAEDVYSDRPLLYIHAFHIGATQNRLVALYCCMSHVIRNHRFCFYMTYRCIEEEAINLYTSQFYYHGLASLVVYWANFTGAVSILRINIVKSRKDFVVNTIKIYLIFMQTCVLMRD